MAANETNYSGLHSGELGINLRSEIEDFLKTEYTHGFREQFASTEALINFTRREQLTTAKKEKTFKLGVNDNVRSIGRSDILSDRWKIEASDFMKAGDYVDAQFETTKYLGITAVTNEVMLKSGLPGALVNVFQQNLEDMERGLLHTTKRYAYGSHTGLIGKVLNTGTVGSPVGAVARADEGSTVASSGVQTGNKPITHKHLWDIVIDNPNHLLPGMGIILKSTADAQITQPDEAGTGTDDVAYLTGKVYQKNNSRITNVKLIVYLDIADAYVIPPGVEIYASQIIMSGGGALNIGREYTGLEDIVMTQDNVLFKINRAVYPQLNCTIEDLDGAIITEEVMRDMSDFLVQNAPEAASARLIAAPHRVVAAVEKQLLQLKEYTLDTKANGFELGRPLISFDGNQIYKDPFARKGKVYFVSPEEFGELVLRDFEWLSQGEQGIFTRIPGTEMYEAIMVKYGDTYVDSFISHAGFYGANDAYGEIKVGGNGLEPRGN
jgi:hypothetical protein